GYIVDIRPLTSPHSLIHNIVGARCFALLWAGNARVLTGTTAVELRESHRWPRAQIPPLVRQRDPHLHSLTGSSNLAATPPTRVHTAGR
ncbi:hypothetical protein GOODEAATRI_012034, partial [Goodea atripinnis]